MTEPQDHGVSNLRLGMGAQCPREEKGLQLPMAWGSGEGVTRRGG